MQYVSYLLGTMLGFLTHEKNSFNTFDVVPHFQYKKSG